MLEALLDADSGGDGILEWVESEAEGRIVVQHLVEKLPALLDLQVVCSVQSPLVDSAPSIHLLGLALSTWHEHIKGNHVINSKFLVINPLFESFLVDDDLVSIYQVLFQLVGQNSLNWVHVIGVCHFLDNFCHFVVGVAGFDQPQCGLGCFVCCQDNICLFACNGGIFVGLNHQGVGGQSCESINVDSKFNFDEVSFLDGGRILLKGWIVSADLISRDGGGEGKTLEDGFFIIDFWEFFVDETVAPETEFEDLGPNRDLFDEFGQDLWIGMEVQLATLAAAWYFSMTPGVFRVYSYSLSINNNRH